MTSCLLKLLLSAVFLIRFLVSNQFISSLFASMSSVVSSATRPMEIDNSETFPSMNNPMTVQSLVPDSKKELLKQFSQETIPNCPTLLSLFFFPVIFGRNPKLALLVAKLEGPEGIASLMYQLQAQNEDAEVAKEEAEKLIEALLSLYINTGVIASLILSIVYPILLVPIEYSQQSIDLIGKDACSVLFYIYYGMIVFAFVLALSLLFDSIQFYKHMGFWATTLTSRVQYASKGGVIYTITKSVVMVYLFAGALPMGVIATVSPIAGFLCICGAVVVVLLANHTLVYEKHMFAVMHTAAGNICKEKNN